MTTIEVKPGTRIGIDEILAGISTLDMEELEKFVDKVLTLRAKKAAPNLSREETLLLKKINRGLSPALRTRLALLESRRKEEILTESEYRELLTIIEDLEQLNAERVYFLGELAQLKGVPIRELMKQLGVHPRSYV
jgi:hypothetical protein